MSHIVESCPLTKLNGGLSRLHSADEKQWYVNASFRTNPAPTGFKDVNPAVAGFWKLESGASPLTDKCKSMEITCVYGLVCLHNCLLWTMCVAASRCCQTVLGCFFFSMILLPSNKSQKIQRNMQRLGYVGIQPEHVGLVAADDTTRAKHQFKFRAVGSSTLAFRHSFAVRTVGDWNSLPSHVVEQSTAASFKEELSRLTSAAYAP